MLRNAYDRDNWRWYRPGGVVRSGVLAGWAFRVYRASKQRGDMQSAACALRIKHAADLRLRRISGRA